MYLLTTTKTCPAANAEQLTIQQLPRSAQKVKEKLDC